VNDFLVDRYHLLWKRWCAIVWHREEVRRINEMVRDDPRLLHCQSAYVPNARAWFIDHACVALAGEIDGTEPSAARTMVEEVNADFPAFLQACKDPSAIDAAVLQKLWQARTNSGSTPTIPEAGIPAIGDRRPQRASWPGRFHCSWSPRSALRAASRGSGAARFAGPASSPRLERTKGRALCLIRVVLIE
jgi:hypothetical protein